MLAVLASLVTGRSAPGRQRVPMVAAFAGVGSAVPGSVYHGGRARRDERNRARRSRAGTARRRSHGRTGRGRRCRFGARCSVIGSRIAARGERADRRRQDG
jgi:hypothetical protein